MKARLIEGPVEGNELNRVIESQDNGIDPIAKRGHTIKGILLGATAKKVAHGLGVLPQGWIATRVRASASAAGYPYETESPTKTHLTLAMGADATVDLRVW